MTVCGYVCCVTAVVKVLKVFKVLVFRYADGVCLCLVCILWQSSTMRFCMTCSLLMLVEDERGDHME